MVILIRITPKIKRKESGTRKSREVYLYTSTSTVPCGFLFPERRNL